MIQGTDPLDVPHPSNVLGMIRCESWLEHFNPPRLVQPSSVNCVDYAVPVTYEPAPTNCYVTQGSMTPQCPTF